jgi:hypothetical protein
MTEVFILLVIFGSVIAAIKIISDNRIRHKLIDREMVNENIRHLYQVNIESRNLSSLKWGMVLIGIGLPLFILRLLPYYITDETIIGAMFIIGGLGLILYYVIVTKMMKQSTETYET